MGDELTVPASQQARDAVASPGPAGARDFAAAPMPTADRAAPTAVIGRLAPGPAAPVDTLMGPLDTKALLHPAGESTTTIAAWKLHGITRDASPGTYTAFVTFQSYQDPACAPNQSDSCDIWALDYTMIQRSGRWLIGQAGPHPGLLEYHTC